MYEAIDSNIDLLDISRELISGPLGNYESNLFSTTIAINPLVAAAMPLLSTTSEIQRATEIKNPEFFLDTLIHEVKAFENKAAKNGYRSQIILGARYLLCALIDEYVMTYHPEASWKKHNLLQIFQHDAWGGERFFIILERSCEDPSLYIDLLELGYVALSLGFQGKYQHPSDTKELALFIDRLYQVIQQQRGDNTHHLLTCSEKNSQKKRLHLPPWWVVFLGTLIILSSIFIPYTNELNQSLTPLLYNIDHYEK